MKRKYRPIDRRHLRSLAPLARLGADRLRQMEAVAAVLPFRVNDYVVEELVDWDRAPDDPIFQLTFPQPGMLARGDRERVERLLARGAGDDEVAAAAREIQLRMNPHPAGQVELNVPRSRGEPVRGLQHKYRETVLVFPTAGQTCHAYCSYCFRWPQFVGLDDMKFATREAGTAARYVAEHREVTDVLVTGGDPLLMRIALLRRYVEPLLAIPHLASIRIGTKAPAYWPHRFVDEHDADELLALFEDVVRAGKHLALMAHYTHPRELETALAETALRRILSTGAVVRCQSPLVRHVNDDARAWAELWEREVRLGAVPYYTFVERDTGARAWFEVPLLEAWTIVRDARSRVSGLARTARGPVMSCTPGKIVVDGPATIRAERVLALRFLQARDPSWVGRPFFAHLEPRATWIDQLRPALADEFFFEGPMRAIHAAARRHLPVHSAA